MAIVEKATPGKTATVFVEFPARIAARLQTQSRNVTRRKLRLATFLMTPPKMQGPEHVAGDRPLAIPFHPKKVRTCGDILHRVARQGPVIRGSHLHSDGRSQQVESFRMVFDKDLNMTCHAIADLIPYARRPSSRKAMASATSRTVRETP